MQKSRVLDNFSPIDIMIVGKEFYISAIFYFKESWKIEAVPDTGGVPFLKGIRILVSNEYQLVLPHRNKPNQTLVAFVKDY